MKLVTRVLPLALAALLASCGAEQPTDAPGSDASSEASNEAAPDAKPGLTLTDGKLVLPAVKDNPAAAYFTLTNGSDKPVTIAAVDVAGASMAMLHETTNKDGHASMDELAAPEIKPGQAITFAPGGKHVMIHGAPATWQVGGTTELTITFADGDKLSAPLAMVAPGSL